MDGVVDDVRCNNRKTNIGKQLLLHPPPFNFFRCLTSSSAARHCWPLSSHHRRPPPALVTLSVRPYLPLVHCLCLLPPTLEQSPPSPGGHSHLPPTLVACSCCLPAVTSRPPWLVVASPPPVMLLPPIHQRFRLLLAGAFASRCTAILIAPLPLILPHLASCSCIFIEQRRCPSRRDVEFSNVSFLSRSKMGPVLATEEELRQTKTCARCRQCVEANGAGTGAFNDGKWTNDGAIG
jgi:hypothetical protein